MATASITETIKAPIDTVFDVITDYESYPEFLPETKSAKILSVEGKVKYVEFQLDLIKRFRYTLKIEEKPNNKISWEFSKGDLFKSNSGGWELIDRDGATEVTYHLDIEFKLFVPKMITKKLAGANLPNMIASFKERAEART